MSHRHGILEALGADGAVVSGQELAARLGISRAAVWKHVEALAVAGYQIERVRSRGYRLVSSPDQLGAEALTGLLAGRRFGGGVVVLDVTRSTNSDALALGREGAPEGSVVLAEAQTGGRGRLGRQWESARGVNLYMSLLLRPAIVPAAAPQLSLVAGVAVAETLVAEGLPCRIKWPNDVVVGGEHGGGVPLRKIAGILTEIEAEADRVSFVVVGIGVNVNSTAENFSPALAGRATSFLMETGRRLDRTALAARLLSRMEGAYGAFLTHGFSALAPRWRALSVLEGRTVEVSSVGHPGDDGDRGTCVGIDADGALLLETAPGQVRRVIAGDVTVRGGYD
ncbi:MAG: biotin--[acetyl-CoA-carboxylase] ligase [Deltaproteobacteria bacterium]|nr:biotin--[acetyl-CoA-carboxylase] ligase [Deltaproteobacteria bacterium]